MEEHRTLTEMLTASRMGSREALDDLFAQLYDELRRIAHRQLGGRDAGGTLNTTAVINEAWLRLVEQTQVGWEDRARFLAYASQTMRGIVVDHARRRGAQKRGGGLVHFSLDDGDLPVETQADLIVAVDEALGRLATLSERLSRIVECRFFGGMSVQETAAALEVSDRTVRRDWIKAKAWLYTELDEAPSGQHL